MDQYLTTYRKDFAWPSKPRFNRREIILPNKAIQRTAVCNCGENGSQAVKIANLQPMAGDRPAVGPMCRLLDPKKYPAKTGPTPENEATKHNQPDAYMKKLEDKYPNICGVLQITPMEQLAAQVDDDRMRSTYQIDFCHETSSLTEGGTCIDPKPPSDIDANFCRQAAVPTHLRTHDSRNKKGSESKKASKNAKAEFGDGQETRIPPWRSEYQDNVSKTGQAILKYRVHAVKKQVEPVWATTS